jgi:hypothetical protein
MAGVELHASLSAAIVAVLVLFLMVFVWPPPKWAFLLPIAAFLGASFWGWTASYRRLQALEDLPLSRIGTAAQGYARLAGRAAAFPGKALRSPVTSQPCCWYSYRVVTFDSRGNVESTDGETTEWSFMMSDGTGECVVDPAGARILPLRVNRYRDKNQSWTEHVILAHDPLYVIGEFTTSGSSVSEYDIDFSTGELIAQWKKDMPALLRRFPPARDGAWSEGEWEQVRRAARHEIEAGLARNPPQGQNRIQKPADGRPFVISAEDPEQLARDLTIWAWLHALSFVIGVGLLAALFLRYL